MGEQKIDTRIHSFTPVVDGHTRLMVIGSMPGVESLRQQQYYAHPRNAFWRIAARVLGEALPDGYEGRLCMLLRHGVGLWDAAASCQRQGSLDVRMRKTLPNDFARLLADYPAIHTLLFNGRKAYEIFCHTHKALAGRVLLVPLPSTSPAAAAMTFEQKLAKWRVLGELLSEGERQGE